MSSAASRQVAAPPGPAKRSRRVPLRERPAVYGVSFLVALVLVWELSGRLGNMNPLFFAAPSRILQEGAALVFTGGFWVDMGVTMLELVVGFLLAALSGIGLGILLGRIEKLDWTLNPLFMALHAAPRVALLPLLVIWFGIGFSSKLALVWLSAFFSIFITTLSGVRSVDPVLIRVAQSFNANRRDLIWKFIIPAAVPSIVAGLRVGVGRALVGVVVGEFFAANAGIGFMIAVAGAQYQTAKLFFGILLMSLMGILGDQALRMVENRALRYRLAARK